MLKSYKVYGKVQGVMFRQTFIRGLLKRGLKGGATNMDDTIKSVNITIESPEGLVIDQVIKELVELKILNSWNASIENIENIQTIPIEEHEVTTSNVDDHKWSSGVDFYF